LLGAGEEVFSVDGGLAIKVEGEGADRGSHVKSKASLRKLSPPISYCIKKA
jgi:hypothetical protein